MTRSKILSLLGAGLVIGICLGFISVHFSNQLRNFNNPGNNISSRDNNTKGKGLIGDLVNMEKDMNEDYKIDPRRLKYYYEEAHKVNPQVIGWIAITNTDISYPVLHGYPDDYYLKHNWRGEPWWNGSVFLDYMNNGIQSISLINGHNMLNGIMFAQLTKFQSESFFDAGQTVYFYDGYDNKLNTYKPIGAEIVSPDVYLDLGNHTKQQREDFVSEFRKGFIYKGIPYNGNNILLLNTCLSNGTDHHIIVMNEQMN